MTTSSKKLFGELLIEKGVITLDQLEEALARQKQTGELLGVILLDLKFIDEETLLIPLLADHQGVRYITLKEIDIKPELINQIPAKFAIHYKIMPFDLKDGLLSIATSRPDDVPLMDEIGHVLSKEIKPVLASEKDILEGIRKHYGVGAATIDAMMGDVDTDETLENQISEIDDFGSDASISKFLNQILLEAYRDHATDIHIEPFETSLQIRYRVDGVLYDAKVPGKIKHFKDSINSRIKILSNLDIAEKRLPQDGRFKVRVQTVELDLRVSFLPSQWGESVVLRLLNSAKLYNFKDLGLPDREHNILKGLINKPHGILFITGPTGSGKTTTLYSCLAEINTEHKKIITIEDPVEYQLKGILQVQVNAGIGLTFAQGLRSMLRHDPDIMMVGEVRDKQTADIAIQIALTGHLMFSTLHTNDAASGVTRLIDMGVDPFLITSTVQCFIAQRLARILCSQCKETTNVAAEHLQEFKDQIKDEKEIVICTSKGCEACHFTGYSGRKAIYEFLLLNDPIRNLIMQKSTSGQIKAEAQKAGMLTLRESGWELVKLGLTNPEELIRITQDDAK